MIRKALVIFVILLVVVLFETALLSNIVFLPVVPDLLLLVVLYISVFNGSLVGETTGFVSGLLLDFITAAPLGLNCLLRTLMGFLAGFFHNLLNVSGILIPCFLAFIATIVKGIMIEFIFFFFPNGVITYELISTTFGMELLFNVILAPMVFGFLSFFSSILVDSKERSR
ncbi:MAG: rod shape-determining protein MreD [Spirochaetaceae bacterium]|nr:rod shape-determining protein MreD [Spirochaetaceae bacterium]